MRLCWVLWLLEIALTALVCFADKPGTAKICRPVSPKGYKIDLTYPGCGNRSSHMGGHPRNQGKGRSLSAIVGGVDADPNSWAWMAALFKKTANIKKFLCGASLISRRYVLTAAHCFDGEGNPINPSNFLVLLGSRKIDDGSEYRVNKVVIHHDYDENEVYNDIAVLQLVNKAIFTYRVFPVCLPSDGLKANIVPNKTKTIVTGWGGTSNSAPSTKVLQEVTLPIISLKDCNDSYDEFIHNNFPKGVTNDLICAGVPAGGKDSCKGDSGGPMVMKLPGNLWIQVGIVALGYGCGIPGYPGVYTRISSFTRWLSDNTDLG